ncbi:hypothetical protein CANARDRAFT_27206 [[Candida] arabinofermentans NRRL YB-2248]|uniref:Uncharacterized protein n=1 Tax=[Candida] arabinofermentans NRRL YB-2248 TaxID=983967 RepID=A0A1E4T520_9ASCO|nr:hypothetical protein CANARDRAFT_27206 [[Candida] arabinofermentans NRRL YB-2248]
MRLHNYFLVGEFETSNQPVLRTRDLFFLTNQAGLHIPGDNASIVVLCYLERAQLTLKLRDPEIPHKFNNKRISS